MHHHRRPTGRMSGPDAAGIYFTTSSGGVGGGSGTSSPPLWSTKSGDLSSPSQARLQAIEKGQRELMEMVRSMPDTSYELSLRDLVELPKPAPASESSPAAGGRRWMARASPEMKQGRGSFSSAKGSGGDFMLRMFFPPSFGGSKNRSRKGRVSPEKYSLDSGDWFKKRSSDHTDHRISRSRRMGGMVSPASCWPFFHGNKSKAGKG